MDIKSKSLATGEVDLNSRIVDHRELSANGFYGYALIIGIASAMQMAWALSDIWTVAPKGINYVAGLGLSDVMNSVLMAITFGVVDLHAAQLAMAEGNGSLAEDYTSYLTALAVILAICTAPVLALDRVTSMALAFAHQPQASIDIAASNFSVRAVFFPVGVFYLATPLALRIAGNRNAALFCIGVASSVKLIENTVIHTGVTTLIPVEKMIAYATVLAQSVAIAAGFIFILYVRALARYKPRKSVFHSAFWDIAHHAPALSAWNLNDYLSSFAVLLILGQAGTAMLAAANIASKITTLFYRLPQACCEAAFVYYGYAANYVVKIRQVVIAVIIHYSILPTLLVAGILWFLAPVAVISLSDIKQPLSLAAAIFIIRTHCIFATAYVIQHLFAQFLTIERKAKFLLVTSAANTYGFVIPVALCCFFILGSWQLMVVCERFSVMLLALANVFWLASAHVSRPSSYFVRQAAEGASR